MCLGIPGKVLEVFEVQGLPMARVQFGGVVRQVCLAYTPQAATGDYVLVHVGFAISKIHEEEAQRTYELLQQMDQLSELDAPSLDEPRTEERK